MLRTIGLLGDIHGEDERVRSALEFFRAQGVPQVLAVGDVADGPGSLQSCVDLLREHNVALVMGNHDDWFLRGVNGALPDAHSWEDLDEEGRAWLSSQPLTREWETPAGRLLLCHGVGRDFMRNLRPDDFGYALESNAPLQELLREGRYRWMVNGHTHTRMARRFNSLTNLNAGKLGDRRENGVEGAAWIIDLQSQRAQLFLFAGSELLQQPHEIALP
jgi:predicted phosphodiesterase